MKEQKAEADCHPFGTKKTTFVYAGDSDELLAGENPRWARALNLNYFQPQK